MASGFVPTFLSGIWLFLTTACVTIAFGFDQWVLLNQSNAGLWRVCVRDVCKWYWEQSRLTIDTDLPHWFIACQVMFALAVGSILLCLCFLPFYMCICSRGGSCFTCLGRTVYSMLSSAALIMGIALLVFGLEVHYSEGQERIWGQKVKALTWAFFLMVAGWCMTVISAVLFFVLHKRSQSHAI
ncbi:PREDICTED: uncharacterized protein LOC106815146 isoform X1 [Priapulus caudatus]|uniref:Uncharacterized protein LOC106815146 isoform X1 n=1 Tax=Priapulus caudatus TaxID=37621 RepID=A0ABM1ES93_PRICU|nr:PREDICTED: uncharacterized protein LOC106815146 isoform X1 [Priapulus caudatus]